MLAFMFNFVISMNGFRLNVTVLCYSVFALNMVAASISEMVGKAVTLTSLGGLKRKRDKVEDIMGRLKRFCGRRDPEPEYDNGVGSKALAEEKVAVSDSLAKESEYRSDADNRVPARGRLSGMTLGGKSL